MAGITRPWKEICSTPIPPQLLLVCAHYDTTPAVPVWRLQLRPSEDAITGLAFLSVLGLAAFRVVYDTLWALDSQYGPWRRMSLGFAGVVAWIWDVAGSPTRSADD